MSPPNILLLILDSVRARNMSIYGHPRSNTPFLNQFSSECVLYEEARAPSIHSIASHASMWTGAHAEQHKMIRHEDKLKRGVTIWEHLANNGYRTGLFTKNTVVAHASNLATQFEETFTNDYQDTGHKIFEDAHGPRDNRNHEGVSGNLKRCLNDDQPLKSIINTAHHAYLKSKTESDSIDSYDIIDRFSEWQSATTQPWAACINLMDAHYPYKPSATFDKWSDEKTHRLQSELSKPPSYEYTHGRPWWELSALENLYDGAIFELDHLIEMTINALRDRGGYDNTLVIITSDHGEGFGERSRANPQTRMVTHSWGIHEVLTHVPLIIKYPQSAIIDRVENTTSLTSIPEGIKKIVAGKMTGEEFTSHGPVISSTNRLREEDRLIFDDSDLDADDYVGPWRAVYKPHDGHINKHIRRGDDAATVRILGPQISYPIRETENEDINDYFDSLESKSLKLEYEDDEHIDSDVENRLSDLGYIR